MIRVLKLIASFGLGFAIGSAIAWLITALATALIGLIGKTGATLVLLAGSFLLGFLGMRAVINKRNAAKPVLLLTKN